MRTARPHLAALALLLVQVPRPARACLWDTDTLAEEALRNKDVAEIVRGRIRKHSTFFYEKKVEYTRPLVAAADAKPERFDDLAVALDKLGRDDEALAVMEEKEKRFPGLYTTLANVGTFHAHKRDFPRALDYLHKAVTLNPKAHFGREYVQIKLIEFIEKAQKDPAIRKTAEAMGYPINPELYMFVLDHKTKPPAGSRFEIPAIPAAVPLGLAGIIRFGNGEKSADVWFSLAVALGWRGDKHLTIFALRQAELLGHPLAAAHADILIRTIRDLQRGGGLRPWDDVTKSLDADFAKGTAWAAAQSEKEDALIRAGKLAKAFGY